MVQPSKRFPEILLSFFMLGGLGITGKGIWNLAGTLASKHQLVTNRIHLSAEMPRHNGGQGGPTCSAEAIDDNENVS